MYKFEIFIRLFNQAKNDSEEEINDKHFIFETVLRTKRDYRDFMNKKRQEPNKCNDKRQKM